MIEVNDIFIICDTENATDDYIDKLNSHILNLENDGYMVHRPQTDTKHITSSLGLTQMDYVLMCESDEIHIFYNSKSINMLFYIGAAYTLSIKDNKKIVLKYNEYYNPAVYVKSYSRMLNEWLS